MHIWAWLVYGMWFLWKRRNKWVFKGILEDVASTIQLTHQCHDEWWKGQKPPPMIFQWHSFSLLAI
ncbi:hypothetical protein Scep_024795 [Stephania cephalantha]|uniref:Uncharacterized protein n=1 Tax=Stephania cephalantha TaxID=152367 RepID=A0AAP0EX84_9MAGN